MLAAIRFAYVPHEGMKRAGIGIAVGIAQRGEEFQGPARLGLGAREAVEIPLHPVGRVAGEAVLPAREPQERET